MTTILDDRLASLGEDGAQVLNPYLVAIESRTRANAALVAACMINPLPDKTRRLLERVARDDLDRQVRAFAICALARHDVIRPWVELRRRARAHWYIHGNADGGLDWNVEWKAAWNIDEVITAYESMIPKP